MKKALIPLMLVMTLLLSVGVNSSDAFVMDADFTPLLSFDGTTATCTATIRKPGKTINATMELWCGNSLLATWSDSNTNLLTLRKSYNGIRRGQTYTLKVYGTANGIAFNPSQDRKTA